MATSDASAGMTVHRRVVRNRRDRCGSIESISIPDCAATAELALRESDIGSHACSTRRSGVARPELLAMGVATRFR
jgi:hypothetical protein